MLVATILKILFAFIVPALAVQQKAYKIDFEITKGDDFIETMKHLFDDIGDELDIFKREENKTHEVKLSNQRAFYVASLNIGTPSKEVKVLIDTGSADLWIMSTKNPYCTTNGGSMDCTTYGTYNEDESTSFVKNDTEFSIQYLDNTFAKGTWGQDRVELTDGLVIEGANFAVADETDSYVGVFGIAYKELESTDEVYDNLPVQMKQQGYINKVAYSLYLTPAERNTGTILFGGIDHAKYTGELVEFDVEPQNGVNVYLQIPLSSITINLIEGAGSSSTLATIATAPNSPTPTTSTSSTSTGLDGPFHSIAAVFDKRSTEIDTADTNALFDSGTTLTYLDQSILNQILDEIAPDSTYNGNMGGYQVPCSLRQEGNSFTFNFDNKKDIEVPLSDMVLIGGQNGTTGQPICMLGILSNSHSILGDNFLRHAYSVFNLDDNTISIAQMNYNDEEEDIEIIQ